MSDNEKLIEEAYRQGRSDEKYSLAYAPPVFEKALGEATVTPTDDEREALAKLLDEIDSDWLMGEARPPYPSEMAHELILRGVGFRRSEVPEPSAEDYPDAEALAALRANAPEPSAIINEGTDDAWQAIADALGNLGYALNSHEETAAWVQQYLFTPEPQGEPSDAQDFKIDHELMHAGFLPRDRDRIRAALRAAGGVEEPEWEYGYTSKWGTITASSQADAESRAADHARGIADRRESGDLTYHGKVVKRIAGSKAGPWVPVEN